MAFKWDYYSVFLATVRFMLCIGGIDLRNFILKRKKACNVFAFRCRLLESKATVLSMGYMSAHLMSRPTFALITNYYKSGIVEWKYIHRITTCKLNLNN